ncbi:APC family permease [Tyzzerella sp. OttesenSCG-928-J15]|nr:APC family permease [Tyzzerella sp. OttesenSCG-928-J15]
MTEKAKSTPTAKLSLGTLIAMCTGQAIGAGVITVTGLAVGVTGRSTWLAYVAAVLVGFILILPIILYSSVVRYRGGQYTLVTSLLGERWGGVYALGVLPMFVAGGTAGLAIGTYINSIFPSVSAVAAGLAVMTFLYLLNMMGINIMAKVQSAMTVFLIICLVTFCLLGLGNLQPGTFQINSEGYFMGGSAGFFSAVAMLMYGTTGQSFAAAFSINAKNAKRDIPIMMMVVTGVILVLFSTIGLVAGNVLPVEVVAGKPLTLVARELFPGPLFYVFVIGGPVMALVTTLNASYPTLCAPIAGATANGWLPKQLAKRNRFGVPFILYTAMYVISILPLLLNFSLSFLTNNTVLISGVVAIVAKVAIFFMPKKFGEHWKSSKLYMKNFIFYPLMTVSLALQLVIIYLNGKALTGTVLLVNIAVFVALVSYALYRHKTGKAHAGADYSFDEDLED